MTLNRAAFTINASTSGVVDGERGYDASAGATLAIQLEANPAAGVWSVRYELPTIAVEDAPSSSLYAEQLTFTESGAYDLDLAGDDARSVVHVVIPAGAKSASYVIRCIASTAWGTDIYDRIVSIRKGGLRHTTPAERDEYDRRGWSDALNELTKVVQDGLGGAFNVDLATTAETDPTKVLTPDGVGGVKWSTGFAASWAAVLAVGAISGGTSPTLSVGDALMGSARYDSSTTAHRMVEMLENGDLVLGVGDRAADSPTYKFIRESTGPFTHGLVVQTGWGECNVGGNRITFRGQNDSSTNFEVTTSTPTGAFNTLILSTHPDPNGSGSPGASLWLQGHSSSIGYATLKLSGGDVRSTATGDRTAGYVLISGGDYEKTTGYGTGGGVSIDGGYNAAAQGASGHVALTAGSNTNPSNDYMASGVTLVGGSSTAGVAGPATLMGGTSSGNLGGAAGVYGGNGLLGGGAATVKSGNALGDYAAGTVLLTEGTGYEGGVPGSTFAMGNGALTCVVRSGPYTTQRAQLHLRADGRYTNGSSLTLYGRSGDGSVGGADGAVLTARNAHDGLGSNVALVPTLGNAPANDGRVVLDGVAWPSARTAPANGSIPVVSSDADAVGAGGNYHMKWLAPGSFSPGYLDTGTANSVLWSDGAENSWSGAPLLTSVALSSHIEFPGTNATAGHLRFGPSAIFVGKVSSSTSYDFLQWQGGDGSYLALGATSGLRLNIGANPRVAIDDTSVALRLNGTTGQNSWAFGNGYVSIGNDPPAGGNFRITGGFQIMAKVWDVVANVAIERQLMYWRTASNRNTLIIGGGTDWGGTENILTLQQCGSDTVPGVIQLDAIHANALIQFRIGGTTRLSLTTADGLVCPLGIRSVSHLAVGSTVASAGAIRMANAFQAYARDAGDTANIRWMMVDGSNVVILGDTGYSTRINGTIVSLYAGGSTKIAADSTGIGFYGTAPVTRPSVTGSKASNAALTSLCVALANLGLITNSTT